jgi:hypothetical protein
MRLAVADSGQTGAEAGGSATPRSYPANEAGVRRAAAEGPEALGSAVVHLGAATACSARGPRPDASQQLPTTGRAHYECLLPVDSAIERPLSAT